MITLSAQETLQVIVKSNWQHTSLDATMKSSQPEFYANASLSSQVSCHKHNIYMYIYMNTRRNFDYLWNFDFMWNKIWS